MSGSESHDTHIPLIAPSLSVLQSSVDLGWDTILVERVRLSAGELYVPRLDDHLVCVALEDDYHVEQSRYGTTFVHTFQPGQAQLLPIDTTGFWRNQRAIELLHLQFSDRFLQQFVADHAVRTGQSVEIVDRFLLDDPQVTHIGYALLAELCEGGLNGRVYANALAMALATHLLRKYASSSVQFAPASPRLTRNELQRALDYIHAHLAEDFSLDTLARLVNLSPSHFNTLFRREIGLAPYRYILHQRVNRAKTLLLRTNMGIAQIAAEVGFYDQSHLTRHMHRLLGVTPSVLHHQRNIPKQR